MLNSIKVSNSAKSDCIPQHFEFACTCRAQENMQTILRAALYRQPLLIEGTASTGKTSAVCYAAHLLQQPVLQLSVAPNTTYSEIIGGIGFSDEDDGMVFNPGVLTQALEYGCWLLLDEANLATDSVLSVLEDVLVDRRLEIPAFLVAADGRYKQRLNADGKLIIPMHESFRLFATQNPPLSSKYRSTRHQLGESLLSHFLCAVFEDPERQEMEQIVQSHLSGSFKEPETSFPIENKQTYFLLENDTWCVAHEAPWNRDLEKRLRASRVQSATFSENASGGEDVPSTTKAFLRPFHVIQATLVFRQLTERERGGRKLALSWSLDGSSGEASAQAKPLEDEDDVETRSLHAALLFQEHMPTEKVDGSAGVMVFIKAELETTLPLMGSTLRDRGKHLAHACEIAGACGANSVVVFDPISKKREGITISSAFKESTRMVTEKAPVLSALILKAENGNCEMEKLYCHGGKKPYGGKKTIWESRT
jgi:hypothetical protein